MQWLDPMTYADFVGQIFSWLFTEGYCSNRSQAIEVLLGPFFAIILIALIFKRFQKIPYFFLSISTLVLLSLGSCSFETASYRHCRNVLNDIGDNAGDGLNFVVLLPTFLLGLAIGGYLIWRFRPKKNLRGTESLMK